MAGRRESRRDFIKREYSNLKPFVIISLSYLLFTTTDGAVRMIVLLHAYRLGFNACQTAIMLTLGQGPGGLSAWQTAIMLTLYEVAGVVTNLLAGSWARGLTLQLAGIGMLFGWRFEWATPAAQGTAIAYVTVAQMLCGVAKDLTKLGGKTVTKLVTPDEQSSRLFKIVSFITGFKNSMKGVGYFIGAAALSYSYYFALALLLGLIIAAMPWAVLGLGNALGRAHKENVTWRSLLLQRRNVNVLSVARFLLFSCRDMWFEVGSLPFFLRDPVYGLGWERVVVGAVLAAFIIGYGQVQSWTPQAVLQPLRQSPANKYVALLWDAALVLCPSYLAAIVLGSDIFTRRDVPAMAGALMPGLFAFCAVVAVNSSVHSYLIVRYAEGDQVAMNVGFYYMANAMGRLTGTLASGALYTFTGRHLAFAVTSAVIAAFVRDDTGGLSCGPCLRLVAAPAPAPAAASARADGAPKGAAAAGGGAAVAVADLEEGGGGGAAGKREPPARRTSEGLACCVQGMATRRPAAVVATTQPPSTVTSGAWLHALSWLAAEGGSPGDALREYLEGVSDTLAAGAAALAGWHVKLKNWVS
ncbi:MAG: hypothetical protein J3K34DRAFT_463952 [Monoraphidium minutum]|nr:MAG: hypothetical protein J3K34DRAFT_463952 [Monoraphidium minutum]